MAASLQVAPRGGPSSENRVDEGEDARVLDVLRDDHGERFRDWRSAATESTQELFADSPVTGLPTALHVMKSMCRTAGDPTREIFQATNARREATAPATSRAHSATLCAAVSYGQSNLGALASVEIQCRRIAVIIAAHNDAQHPSWTTARFYSEGTQADAAITPVLLSHVLRGAKDEADIFASR